MAGVPRITGIPVPFEIAQTPNKIYILYESNHIFRIIPSDGRPHPEELDPAYMGDSAGHWDGGTLVVDVTGFNDKPWQYRLVLRHPPRDERIMEAECEENNQDLQHIVPDAR